MKTMDEDTEPEDYGPYIDHLSLVELRAEIGRVASERVRIRQSIVLNDYKRRFRRLADVATTRFGAVSVSLFGTAAITAVLFHRLQLPYKLALSLGVVLSMSSGVLCLWTLFCPDDVTLDLLIRNSGRKLLKTLNFTRALKDRAAFLGDELSIDEDEFSNSSWRPASTSPPSGNATTIPVRPGIYDKLIRYTYTYQTPRWKLMSGVEFERYLVIVFEELGFTVETTKASGDQGVDLILSRYGRRWAVQAKGYPSGGSVGNKAVQEAYTGMAYYSCHNCIVITNSSFTRQAYDLARKVGCRLIDRDRMTDLIEGKITLQS